MRQKVKGANLPTPIVRRGKKKVSHSLALKKELGQVKASKEVSLMMTRRTDGRKSKKMVKKRKTGPCLGSLASIQRNRGSCRARFKWDNQARSSGGQRQVQ